jgi:hypothetical protein
MEKILKFISQLQINLLGMFIDDPTDKSFGDFLESIFGSPKHPEKSNLNSGNVSSFRERSTMAIFELAVMILRTQRMRQYKYSFDKPLGKGNLIKLDAYISTLIWEILIEAKKVIPADLVDKIGRKRLSDKELKELKIKTKPTINDYCKFQFKWDENGNENINPIPCKTVEEITTSALNQLTHYIRQMKSLDEFKNSKKQIKAFAYVHIMKNRYIIVEHKWNGKYFSDSEIEPK